MRITASVDGSYARLLDAMRRRHNLTGAEAAGVAVRTLLEVEGALAQRQKVEYVRRGETRLRPSPWQTAWRIGPPDQAVAAEVPESVALRFAALAGAHRVSTDQAMQAAIDTASELDHLGAQGWKLRLRPRVVGRTRLLSIGDVVALHRGVEAAGRGRPGAALSL